MVRNAHESRLRDHSPHLPPLGAADSELVHEMRRTGVARTSLDDLALPGTDDIKRILGRLRNSLSATDAAGTSAIKPDHRELMVDEALWRWGLEPRLLDIVENYIGLPVRYHGAAVYRELADGRVGGTRQWHRDIEDHRVFKILVWLNDVGPRGGAFEYVPKPASDEAVRKLKYVGGFVSDDALGRLVSPSEWTKATGPQWTAVLADTAAIMHRASTAESADRYSVTFTWTSSHPLKTMPIAEPMSAEEESRIRAGLSPRQLACLP